MRYAWIALTGGLALSGCQAEADDKSAAAAGERQVSELEVADESAAHPPLGRYVCRQYMTTIGWIDLSESGYSVAEVEGSYSYDRSSGDITWESGAYAGWPARNEFSPAGEGHAHDESIIRMTDETGDLKIDRFLTRD